MLMVVSAVAATWDQGFGGLCWGTKCFTCGRLLSDQGFKPCVRILVEVTVCSLLCCAATSGQQLSPAGWLEE